MAGLEWGRELKLKSMLAIPYPLSSSAWLGIWPFRQKPKDIALGLIINNFGKLVKNKNLIEAIQGLVVSIFRESPIISKPGSTH